MCSGMGDRTCLLPGFPIRTSPDQSSVDSSPGLFAASHVLLRLLMPRHPPCALINLATKMLASTVQFSSYGRSRTPGPRLQLWLEELSLDGSTTAARGGVGPRRVRQCPFPQDPTACRRRRPHSRCWFHPLPVTRSRSTEH